MRYSHVTKNSQIPRHLLSNALEWINEILKCPYLLSTESTAKETGLEKKSAGIPVWRAPLLRQVVVGASPLLNHFAPTVSSYGSVLGVRFSVAANYS